MRYAYEPIPAYRGKVLKHVGQMKDSEAATCREPDYQFFTEYKGDRILAHSPFTLVVGHSGDLQQDLSR